MSIVNKSDKIYLQSAASFTFVLHCDHNLIRLMDKIQCTDKYCVGSVNEKRKEQKKTKTMNPGEYWIYLYIVL